MRDGDLYSVKHVFDKLTCFYLDNKVQIQAIAFLADLWRAPEFLNTPKYTGSSQGDVYSVGIILQEIICEDYPYPNCHYSTEGKLVFTNHVFSLLAVLMIFNLINNFKSNQIVELQK